MGHVCKAGMLRVPLRSAASCRGVMGADISCASQVRERGQEAEETVNSMLPCNSFSEAFWDGNWPVLFCN